MRTVARIERKAKIRKPLSSCSQISPARKFPAVKKHKPNAQQNCVNDVLKQMRKRV